MTIAVTSPSYRNLQLVWRMRPQKFRPFFRLLLRKYCRSDTACRIRAQRTSHRWTEVGRSLICRTETNVTAPRHWIHPENCRNWMVIHLLVPKNHQKVGWKKCIRDQKGDVIKKWGWKYDLDRFFRMSKCSNYTQHGDSLEIISEVKIGTRQSCGTLSTIFRFSYFQPTFNNNRPIKY